ncbi:MAG: hypothetical protein IPK83_24405 [Planctomycetes bacterium]|nr:hypothetical protein [Planctomycetota bacterium]
MKQIFKYMSVTCCLALPAALSACDALSLFGPNVRLSIVAPGEGSQFGPGDTVAIELAIENFTLVEPDDAKSHNAHPTGDDPLGIGDDDHPDGAFGHYRIYLDGEADTDEHVIDHDLETQIVLPNDLAVGTHTIRISLRNHDDTPLADACAGCTAEASVSIECVAP